MLTWPWVSLIALLFFLRQEWQACLFCKWNENSTLIGWLTFPGELVHISNIGHMISIHLSVCQFESHTVSQLFISIQFTQNIDIEINISVSDPSPRWGGELNISFRSINRKEYECQWIYIYISVVNWPEKSLPSC